MNWSLLAWQFQAPNQGYVDYSTFLINCGLGYNRSFSLNVEIHVSPASSGDRPGRVSPRIQISLRFCWFLSSPVRDLKNFWAQVRIVRFEIFKHLFFRFAIFILLLVPVWSEIVRFCYSWSLTNRFWSVNPCVEGADIPPLSLYIVNIEITNYDSRKYGQKQS